MFSDRDIAKQLSCGERKVAYISTFGTAAHFSFLMTTTAKKESGHVIFDKSLNQGNEDMPD